MQQTLLTIVSDMLVAIDAEGVEDVTDTEEAAACVSLANMAYESIIYKAKWKHLKTYTNLISSDANNKLQGVANTIHIDANSVYYNGTRINYLYPKDFIALTQSRTVGSNISVVGGIKCITNQYPTYFTSFDDTTLVFDSTPTTAALTPSSSNALLWVGPALRMSANGDIFNLPAPAFPLLKDVCIGMAINTLKGDTVTGERYLAEAKSKLATLTQKGDMIEKNPDILRNIITRKSTSNGKVINIGTV